MSERLVAIEREGTLHLYAVNGSGPVEVGRLDVGPLDLHAVAIVGAALSDLRTMITSGQLGREPMPVARPRSSLLDSVRPAARPIARPIALPRSRRPRSHTLNGELRAYLTEHGPSTLDALTAALDPPPVGGKSGRARLTAALHGLKAAGKVEQAGAQRGAVWSAR